MLRMFSSAFGDLLEKFSHASNRIAEGDVEPGRKTETDDASSRDEWRIERNTSTARTGHLLHDIACVWTDYADAVRIRDSERRPRVEVPR